METVYHFRNDVSGIAQMQAAALANGPVGLRVTHGLIGSEEWWSQIQAGTLPINTVVGVVSAFWAGQWGDGPAEFEVCRPSGERTRWLCQVEPIAAKAAFRVGRPITLQYVNQELKTAFNNSHEAKVIVSIQLG